MHAHFLPFHHSLVQSAIPHSELSVWCFSQATKSVVNDVSKLESELLILLLFLVVLLHVYHTVTSLCVYIHLLYIYTYRHENSSFRWFS